MPRMIKEHNELPTNISLIIIMIFAITLACFFACKFPPHKTQKPNIEIVKK
jgi:hypothetical protein